MKKNAGNTLKTIADNHRKLISERLTRELVIKDEAEAAGNAAAARLTGFWQKYTGRCLRAGRQSRPRENKAYNIIFHHLQQRATL